MEYIYTNVVTKDYLGGSIWAPIYLYVRYVVILQIGPITSLGLSPLSLNTRTFLWFLSVPLCFPVFFSLSLSPIFPTPNFLCFSPLYCLLLVGLKLLHFVGFHAIPLSPLISRIIMSSTDSLETCSKSRIGLATDPPKSLTMIGYQPKSTSSSCRIILVINLHWAQRGLESSTFPYCCDSTSAHLPVNWSWPNNSGPRLP